MGDVNGDGRLDLVVANYRIDTVSVLLGNGDGTFQAARNFPAGRYPISVVVGVGQVLYQMAGVDLTVLEAIDSNTALVLLSEIGADVSRLPTVKQFTSWLGLSPQHQESAGKIRRHRVRRGANRAGGALRLAVFVRWTLLVPAA